MRGIRYVAWALVGMFIALQAQTVTLNTPAIQRTISIDQQRLHTQQLVNRFTGESLTLSGEEFALRLYVGGWKNASFDPNPKQFTARDFTVRELKPFTAQDTTGYVAYLQHPLGLELQVRYYVRKGHPELYKELSITNHTGYPILIDNVVVESWQTALPEASHQGFGQPVYLQHFYLGIAYPTGENYYRNGQLTLRHIAGRSLSPGQTYRSHPAIIGAAPANQLEATFLAYIERIKAHPTRPFLLYNSWYDIRRLTDKNCARTIQEFQQYMVQPYGLKLDAFVLDDGWDNYQSCWDISREQFPQEFRQLQQRLNTIQSHLGLWASPWGGYDQRRKIRVGWARKHGFETSGDMLCIAGTRYYQCFREKLLRYQREFGIRFFKLDGLLTRCNATDHGHLPGVYSREQAVAHFIDLMKAMRQQDPEVFIDITVGTWLSPWWLQYADCVWMTGADYAYTQELPLYSERDKAITYRDQVLHDNYLVARYQFPFSGLMTHGIIKGRLNLLGGKNETLREFTNNAVIYFSRGVMMWELYITPSILSKAEWDNLAQTIRWAYANEKLLQHTQFVLGNPRKGEVYGYLHQDGQRVLLTLRNPALFPQTVTLPIATWVPGEWRSQPLLLKIQYPYLMNHLIPASEAAQTTLRLEGNEILVLEILPQSAEQLPLPLDTRYRLVIDGERTTVQVFPPAQPEVVLLRPHKSRVRLLNREVQFNKTRTHYVLKGNTSAAAPLSISNARLTVQPDQATLQFHITVNSAIKDGRVLALWESPTPLDTLTVTARVNQQSRTVDIKRDGDGKWWWLALPLQESATATLEIRTPQSPMAGQLSAIVEATVQETPWAQYEIRSPGAPATALLPSFSGEHRMTLPVIQRISLQPGK